MSAWEAGATWETLASAAKDGDGAPVSETDSDDSLQPYDLSEGPDEGAALPHTPFLGMSAADACTCAVRTCRLYATNI